MKAAGASLLLIGARLVHTISPHGHLGLSLPWDSYLNGVHERSRRQNSGRDGVRMMDVRLTADVHLHKRQVTYHLGWGMCSRARDMGLYMEVGALSGGSRLRVQTVGIGTDTICLIQDREDVEALGLRNRMLAGDRGREITLVLTKTKEKSVVTQFTTPITM